MQDKKIFCDGLRLRDRTAASAGCRLPAAGVLRHDACSSGNAALWFIIVLAALVVVTLAYMMGRSPNGISEPVYNDVPAMKPAQDGAQQDAHAQTGAQRTRRPLPPDIAGMTDREFEQFIENRRAGIVEDTPEDPRQRKRSLERRYESMRSADEPADWIRDRSDDGYGFDGGDYWQDEYEMDADVSGSSGAVTPA